MIEVILLAGGNGRRMAASVEDKILQPLAGKSAFQRCLEAFQAVGLNVRLIVAVRDKHQQRSLESSAALLGLHPVFVLGGAERSDSVRNALAATSPGRHLVCIHDCARALIRPESLRMVLDKAEQDGAAVLARTVTDTIKRVPDAHTLDKTSPEDLDRQRLWAMETPQVFQRDSIFEAYQQLQTPMTDDVAVALAAGIQVSIVPNPYPNPKLTHPEDFAYCAWLLERPSDFPL